jgi:hypothetical protein
MRVYVSLTGLVLILQFFATSGLAQLQKHNDQYHLIIRKISAPILVDGREDEQAWSDADEATQFHMVLPMDTSRAKVRTVVKMAYDDEHIYLIAICYHALPGPYVVESLRRDFNFGKNDNFIFFLDTFDDRTNGFSFGSNAAGAQWDGMMYEGGKIDLSWDNKWVSEVRTYEDRWVFEMAVPFKSIRYKKGIQQWGVNFSRLDVKTTEKSAWAPVPRQFPTASLAYTGNLIWDQPPPEPGLNISLIPYVLGKSTRNFEASTPTDFQGEVGGDAKLAITSSLNLDLTVNPDFSQVEVDRQVTNLDRFELFFPERRQFFLENGDLFANFGYQNIRPFFSRRIGLGVPIQFGARLSGKINRDWRIGAMDMQTGSVDSIGLPVQNFAVLAVQRRVFSRSNIGLLMINKESVNYTPGNEPADEVYSQYNRTLGLEYNLASANNLWTGKALVFKTFSPGVDEDEVTHAANLQYSSKRLLVSAQYEFVGTNFNAEVGYVPRKDYVKVNPQISYLFFPSSKKILSHGPVAGSTYFFNTSLDHTDDETYAGYKVTFRSQSNGLFWIAHNYVMLLNPFDPTNSGKDSLAAGSQHWWNAFGLEYYSKPQSMFTYEFSTRYGGYYADGTRFNLTTSIGYRFQPYVSLNLSSSYNDIRMPDPWGKTTFWLIGPRIDVTLTNKLFITAFTQYNQQIDNVNLNARLQWRYRPASDLFIVYTDNYFADEMKVKNRALVVKFTYWWNI